MQLYNFPPVTGSNKNLHNSSKSFIQPSKSNKGDRSYDQKSHRTGRGEFFNEESLCVSEENRFENVINPKKLAD